MSKNKTKVIAIGNLTKDVFIKVKKPCFKKGSKQEIEKIYFSYGGGALNLAINLNNLEIKTKPLGSVGKKGEEIIKFLKKRKIDCSYLTKKGESSYSAILTGNFDRVILAYGGAIAHYDVKDFPENPKTEWFYLSSLHGNFKLLEKIFRIAEKRKIKIAWNPGKSELKKNISKLLKKTEILFLNKEEYALLRAKNLPKITVITKGSKGAEILNQKIKEKAIKAKIEDKTGAGDAFASAFLAGKIWGWNLKKCLKAGVINAGKTIEKIGANTSLKKKELIQILKSKKQI